MSLFDEINKLRERMTTIETHIGKTPAEGLRSDVADLKSGLRRMEMRAYIFYGIAITVVFLIEHAFAPGRSESSSAVEQHQR